MKNINTVVIEGRLTRDAEQRFSNAGMSILKFSIASNSRRKIDGEWQDDANFFDCVILGKLGEAISPRMKKGNAVIIDGELQQNKWKDDSGQNRSKVEILVFEISIYEKGGNSGDAI